MLLRIKWAEAHHLYAGSVLFILGIVGVAQGIRQLVAVRQAEVMLYNLQ